MGGIDWQDYQPKLDVASGGMVRSCRDQQIGNHKPSILIVFTAALPAMRTLAGSVVGHTARVWPSLLVMDESVGKVSRCLSKSNVQIASAREPALLPESLRLWFF